MFVIEYHSLFLFFFFFLFTFLKLMESSQFSIAINKNMLSLCSEWVIKRDNWFKWILQKQSHTVACTYG